MRPSGDAGVAIAMGHARPCRIKACPSRVVTAKDAPPCAVGASHASYHHHCLSKSRSRAKARLNRKKKRLFGPPAEAGGKEEPAEARLKIAPKTMSGFLIQNMLHDCDRRHVK